MPYAGIVGIYPMFSSHAKQQEFKRLLHLLQEHREQLEMQLWPLEKRDEKSEKC